MFRRLFRPRVRSDELVELLYRHLVLADEGSTSEWLSQCFEVPADAKEAFTRRVLFYLSASVALALVNEAPKQPNVAKAVALFRGRVISTALDRWGASHADAEKEIEEADSNLRRLLDTNPKDQPALHFRWAEEWLAPLRIQVTNPERLFRISEVWIRQFVCASRTLRDVRVVP